MTQTVVALALVGSLLSAVTDVLNFLNSLREPGPVLASALTKVLCTTVPTTHCIEVTER
jgi:hypothetical protein